VVADYDTTGALRGYCRYDDARVAEASSGFARPGARTLLGDGVFIMTIDQGDDTERYQGVTPIVGETLALSAEHLFRPVRAGPTRVRLAVGQVQTAGVPTWRAGGLILQNIASDDARGSTEDAWEAAQAYIATSARTNWSTRRSHRNGCSTGCSTRPACACSSPGRSTPSVGARKTGSRCAQVLPGLGTGRDGRGRRHDPGDLRVLFAHL